MKSTSTVPALAFTDEVESPLAEEENFKSDRSYCDITEHEQVLINYSGRWPISTLAALRRKGGKVTAEFELTTFVDESRGEGISDIESIKSGRFEWKTA